MNGLIHSSLYFGMLVSVGAYMLGVWLKKKTGWAILNPLLVAIIVVIAFLSVFHIEYKEYNRGAVYLGYFLTPATVCLAIPLYKQLELLRQHLIAVASAIVAGVAGSVGSIYVMCRFFQLEHCGAGTDDQQKSVIFSADNIFDLVITIGFDGSKFC